MLFAPDVLPQFAPNRCRPIHQQPQHHRGFSRTPFAINEHHVIPSLFINTRQKKIERRIARCFRFARFVRYLGHAPKQTMRPTHRGLLILGQLIPGNNFSFMTRLKLRFGWPPPPAPPPPARAPLPSHPPQSPAWRGGYRPWRHRLKRQGSGGRAGPPTVVDSPNWVD